jgi:hypothetical protein
MEVSTLVALAMRPVLLIIQPNCSSRVHQYSNFDPTSLDQNLNEMRDPPVAKPLNFNWNVLHIWGSIVIIFSERPTLLPLYLPSESVDQGSYVQLTCIATAGDLPLDFHWAVDGRRVPESTVSRVSPQTSLLILNSVGIHQAGNYSCHVNNSAGRSNSAIQVKVNGKLSWRWCPLFNCVWFLRVGISFFFSKRLLGVESVT